MPVHDWKLASGSDFQEFHFLWIAAIRHALNSGLLPSSYYAIAESRIMGYEPDALAYEKSEPRFRRTPAGSDANSGTTLLSTEVAPKVRYVDHTDHWSDLRGYRIQVRNTHGERLIAIIEIVSHANKDRSQSVSQFNEKIAESLHSGCNAMVIDVHRPGRADPSGMHWSFWSQFAESPHPVTSSEPLGVASYHAPVHNGTLEPLAYFETVAIGQNLPDMPLFLDGVEYINLPLQSLYDQAWAEYPAHWKSVLEAPKTA